MSACSAEWNEKLSAWFDGEASPQEAAEVKQHVGGCVDCAAAHVAFRELRAGLRAVPAPTLSPERVRRRLEEARRPQVRHWLAAAAALLLVVMGVVLARSPTLDAGLMVELEAQHLKGFAHGRPCEFESSDPKSVEAWIEANVSQSVTVPQLPGATLLGARRCKLGGQTALALVYQSEGKGLTVFVPPADSRPAASAVAFADGGTRCTTGTMGERICATSSRTRRAAVAVGNDEQTVLLASAAVAGGH